MLKSTLWPAKKTCAALKSLKMSHVSVTPLLNIPGSVLMLVDILWTGEPQNCVVSITGDSLCLCPVTNNKLWDDAEDEWEITDHSRWLHFPEDSDVQVSGWRLQQKS